MARTSVSASTQRIGKDDEDDEDDADDDEYDDEDDDDAEYDGVDR